MHRRLIAIGMIRLVGGTSPTRLILGIMLATGLLQWLDLKYGHCLDDAPVAIALCRELPGPKSIRALMLGSLTLLALVVLRHPSARHLTSCSWESMKKPQRSIGFMDWMLLGGPLAIVFLLIAWFYLTRNVESVENEDSLHRLPRLNP